jgi:hypothetical protein
VLVSKVALGLAAGLVLTTAGIAWGTLHQLQNLGSSSAIADDAPKSQHGAQNILVMVLTTRLDQNGNPLPQEVLDQLHAGDGSQGGYNTNTMIVLHVPNDGSKAMAISIPRDDEVTFVDAPDGQRTGKIKEAYGLAKDQKWNQLYRQGVTDHNTLERDSREAGRKSTIANLHTCSTSPSTTSPRSASPGSTTWPRSSAGSTCVSNMPPVTPTPGPTFPLANSTSTARRHWRSCVNETTCPTTTSTAPTGSRRSLPR